MSGQFYVEANRWARWPRVLVMCKKTGDGIERRHYIPAGGTRDQWNERMRKIMCNYAEAANKLNARLLEESQVPSMQAEVDGLRWAIDERDELICDMARELRGLNDGGVPTDCMEYEQRIREMGINNAQPERLSVEGV